MHERGVLSPLEQHPPGDSVVGGLAARQRPGGAPWGGSPGLEGMGKRSDACRLGMTVLWLVLESGCSAGTAALGPMDCRPVDSTMACCIKKHPYDPVGACDCFRWCEGQRQWPYHMCWPKQR